MSSVRKLKNSGRWRGCGEMSDADSIALHAARCVKTATDGSGANAHSCARCCVVDGASVAASWCLHAQPLFSTRPLAGVGVAARQYAQPIPRAADSFAKSATIRVARQQHGATGPERLSTQAAHATAFIHNCMIDGDTAERKGVKPSSAEERPL